ncbi:MAG TPA: SDR family oxidoreductase [Gaiellaceae bacterium]|jgi:NAD(P)-dependent dehydrogenase (short-subunit alcohol dehydrogenase family)
MTTATEREDLAGLGVAVTGAAGDLGGAMALELARRGAHVTMLDRVAEAEATDRIAAVGAAGRCSYRQVDVTDRAGVAAALAAVEPLDVAIGNAGIVEAAPFLDVSQGQWQKHLDVNVTGCFNVGQAAAQLMVERGTRGQIIFTGSWVGEIPWPEISAYSVSKAAVRMLARSMARELASRGIRVNVVAPGIVMAGMARRQYETDPDYARRASVVIPLGEFGTAEQVAKATAFLCSTDADYMTGSVLLVDGGASLFQFAD